MGTLKIKIPDQEIVEYYHLEEKAQGFIYRGKNAGDYGTIMKIEKTFGINASLVKIESDKGVKRATLYDYIFVTGKDKAAIKLPEMSSN
jgi:small subunit ribosomal protein S4e